MRASWYLSSAGFSTALNKWVDSYLWSINWVLEPPKAKFILWSFIRYARKRQIRIIHQRPVLASNKIIVKSLKARAFRPLIHPLAQYTTGRWTVKRRRKKNETNFRRGARSYKRRNSRYQLNRSILDAEWIRWSWVKQIKSSWTEVNPEKISCDENFTIFRN